MWWGDGFRLWCVFWRSKIKYPARSHSQSACQYAVCVRRRRRRRTSFVNNVWVTLSPPFKVPIPSCTKKEKKGTLFFKLPTLLPPKFPSCFDIDSVDFYCTTTRPESYTVVPTLVPTLVHISTNVASLVLGTVYVVLDFHTLTHAASVLVSSAHLAVPVPVAESRE